MNDEYRDITTKMEDAGTKLDYVVGWQTGYLGHPEREEQRVNDAYTAGYEDGQAKKTDGYSAWAA
jgi:hypothetical protein